MQDGLKTRPFFALFIFILKHAEDDETRENSATAVQIVRDTWEKRGRKTNRTITYKMVRWVFRPPQKPHETTKDERTPGYHEHGAFLGDP